MRAGVGERRRTRPFPPSLERLAAGFFLLLAWQASVIAAEAPSLEERAGAHLEAGNAKLEAEDFAGAIAEYRAGFALYPRASLLFNIGLAQLQLGKTIEAAEAFEGVLARPETTPEVAAEARDQLESIQKKLAVVAVSGGHGAVLAIDGQPRGTLPLKSSVRVLPGSHAVTATKEGYRPFERRISSAPGARVDLVAELEPLPPPPKPRPRYWLWGTLGAVLVAGAVIGLVATQRSDRMGPRPPCMEPPKCVDIGL
jgi:tetratricopeptide (TPR) repeat protein